MRDIATDKGPTDVLHHMVLPEIAAALVAAGIIARLFATAMLDVLNEDFVDAMRARGLKRLATIRRVTWNALPPLLTIAGLQLAYLISGVVFVETIFNWPGLGLLVFQSITRRDLPVIQAAMLLSAAVFVVLNAAIDITHRLIDPRIEF